MADDDQTALPAPVSPGAVTSGKPRAIYLELDHLLGIMRRKNHSILNEAFALSKDRLTQSIIWRLSESGPLTAKDLSLQIGSSPSSISGAVADLVRLGVIVKSSGPRGTEPLSISGPCKDLIKKHIDYVKHILEDSFRVLDEDERSNFIEYVKRITARLEILDDVVKEHPGYYFTGNEEIDNQSDTGMGSNSKENNDEDKTSHKREKKNLTVTLVEKQTNVLERIIKFTLKE